jgi:L-ascorbate metabolism protein UlaG (beta-lactamase superfamily)
MVKCYFLGNACIEIIGGKDHLIIDPVFLSYPQKGIEKIFITHHHPDHVEKSKLKEIDSNYLAKNKNLEIYGPECLYEQLNIEFILIIPGSKIELNGGYVSVYENNCWKAEGCVAYSISIDNKNILHTADSANFSSSLRALKNQIDLCFIACFEENFIDYLKFIKEISPKKVIPYHYTIEKKENSKKLFQYLNENDINAHSLNIGEYIEI